MKDDFLHCRISSGTKARLKDLAARKGITVSMLLDFLIGRECFKDMITDHSIEILQKYGHYIIYLDNEFYCTADSWFEAMEEIDAAQKETEVPTDE